LVFYGASYIAVFAYSQAEIVGIANYVYWFGILGIIIAYLFDRQIHAAFGATKFKKIRRDYEVGRYSSVERELDKVTRTLDRGVASPSLRKNLEDRKKHFEKELLKIMKSL